MTKLQNLAGQFAREENGASLVEYSVLIGLLTAAAVTLIATTGTTVVAKWTTLNGVFK